jgi:hypothetical protein
VPSFEQIDEISKLGRAVIDDGCQVSGLHFDLAARAVAGIANAVRTEIPEFVPRLVSAIEGWEERLVPESTEAQTPGRLAYEAPVKATDLPGATRGDFETALALRSLRVEQDKRGLESQFMGLMPYLNDRYGKRLDLNVLEIGPARTTAVARTLASNCKLYVGLDCDPALVKVQQEFLNKEDLSNARALVGDVYNLSIATDSQDVVFASRTTPLSSAFATRESLTRAYSEIARVLKPNGEFVLYPSPRKEIRSFDPSATIFQEIERITIPSAQSNLESSQLLILKKR